MITREINTQIERVVRANPEETCYDLGNGVFVVKEGDKSCLKGSPRLSGKHKVDGVQYEVYIGGRPE